MKYLIVAAILMSVVGCSSLPLDNGAELVRVTHNEPSQTECKFLGDVTGSQEGLFTSSAELETGARNDLKNKALKLGGNVVYLLTQRAGEIGLLASEYGGSTSQINVTLSGNVYFCPNT
jgi:hypothetical protein